MSAEADDQRTSSLPADQRIPSSKAGSCVLGVSTRRSICDRERTVSLRIRPGRCRIVRSVMSSRSAGEPLGETSAERLANMDARLKVLSGPGSGETIPVLHGKLLIGREQDCHLRLESGLVSRHHCVLLLDEYTLRIRDLGSRNGTYVNGQSDQQRPDGVDAWRHRFHRFEQRNDLRDPTRRGADRDAACRTGSEAIGFCVGAGRDRLVRRRHSTVRRARRSCAAPLADTADPNTGRSSSPLRRPLRITCRRREAARRSERTNS